MTTARGMADKGGMRPFFKGITPTVYRDLVFGGLYSLLRHELYNRLSPFLREDSGTGAAGGSGGGGGGGTGE